jgi:hypothetical protein
MATSIHHSSRISHVHSIALRSSLSPLRVVPHVIALPTPSGSCIAQEPLLVLHRRCHRIPHLVITVELTCHLISWPCPIVSLPCITWRCKLDPTRLGRVPLYEIVIFAAFNLPSSPLRFMAYSHLSCPSHPICLLQPPKNTCYGLRNRWRPILLATPSAREHPK